MWFLVGALLACFALSANSQNYTMSFDDGNFNVSWTHNRTTEELEFEVLVNATGYVSFGFTFTPEDMQNYSIVVGGTNSSGHNYFNSYHTSGLRKPTLDADPQIYTLDSAAEENGTTTLRFRRPLETSDSRDIQFNETTRVFLVWAYHKNSDADNVLMYHTNRNYTEEAVQVVFPPLEMTSTPPAPMTRDRPTAGSSSVQVVVGGFALSVLATLMF
ncbi:DBH-like monooxygenase protein 2 homolog [Stylophora pistillata]|uniref:DBH-like monooxygenase protein 1 n=1 Tax=Stylophora pistillata TaxID=50429 RepID=A0A2B4SKD5_STYPI|nr:DBH-like monooxygenase protein 2 homolog [Stylophora pistillata]PFX29038.1 DBH-like monooxygenase protein 1 [Stylophora pistillata]